jgi:DNA-binding Lrp family transcriptional regulator
LVVQDAHFRYLLRYVGLGSKEIRRMPLDKLDISILEALQGDGRMSNAALAEYVGLSQSACSRRLDNLEKSGVISGYHARLSSAALGNQTTAIVHISLSGQFEKSLAEFEAAIHRCPNVLSCHLMSGEYDYILRISVRDLQDYERIHKEWLSAMPHVTKINTSFALREVIDRTTIGIRPEPA